MGPDPSAVGMAIDDGKRERNVAEPAQSLPV